MIDTTGARPCVGARVRHLRSDEAGIVIRQDDEGLWLVQWDRGRLPSFAHWAELWVLPAQTVAVAEVHRSRIAPPRWSKGPRACGVCGGEIPRGVDWPFWKNGRPVHSQCADECACEDPDQCLEPCGRKVSD